MVLGKLPVPGRPIIWIRVGQGPTALAVGAGEGCLDIFTLIYPFSPLSPSLWETARYRLKYCLKGLLNPKSTNQQLRRDHSKVTYSILAWWEILGHLHALVKSFGPNLGFPLYVMLLQTSPSGTFRKSSNFGEFFFKFVNCHLS